MRAEDIIAAACASVYGALCLISLYQRFVQPRLNARRQARREHQEWLHTMDVLNTALALQEEVQRYHERGREHEG